MAERATPIRRYRDYVAGRGLTSRLRAGLRNTAVFALSLAGSPARGGGWIRFPFYHHVFDDERAGFARQLAYMARFGEFLSLDDAVAMMQGTWPFAGRYFCIGFDDGFKNCATNAVPILDQHDAPAVFYLTTGYIGLTPEADAEALAGFYGDGRIVEFLAWTDCRTLVEAGMTIGSHTVTHARLADLDAVAVEDELRRSKAEIETRLGIECRHFCSPWGRPGVDFRPERDPAIAATVGYRSFATTRRGAMRAGGSPFDIRRDHLVAAWGDYQLRHFLGGRTR